MTTAAKLGHAAASWLSSRLWSWTAHGLNLSAIEPAELQVLRDAWAEAQDDDGVARLNRFNPRDLGRILRNIALTDVRGGAARATYRLVGANLTRLYGRDLTGLRVDECYSGAILAEVVGAYATVIAERGPLFSTREFQLFGRCFGYRRLLLPLSADGRTVTHVVLGLYPSNGLNEAADWRPYEQDLAVERFRAAFGDPVPSAARPVKPMVRPR